MSLLNKFQSAASRVGTQATAFGTRAIDQAEQFAGGFTLDKECDKAAKTLQSFVANPEDPQSALNSIPKAVLRRAKALAIFTVFKVSFFWSALTSELARCSRSRQSCAWQLELTRFPSGWFCLVSACWVRSLHSSSP